MAVNLAVDLHALMILCRMDTASPDEANRLFWERLKGLAKVDTLAYGLYVHGEEAKVYVDACYAMHLRIISGAADTRGKILAVTPPEHFKTTFVRWFIERWLGSETEKHFANPKHPAPCSIYAMNAATQAVRNCKAIASTIEANARYHELFPHAVPDKGWGWSSEQFYLQRLVPRPDPSLLPVGVTGPIQGMRAGLGVVDDPTDQQDARSPKTMQAQIDWRLGVYADRLTENAIQIDIFTRWSKTDLFSVLSKDEDRDVIVMPAVADAGHLGFWSQHPEYGYQPENDVLWPDLWPYTRLMDKKREKMLKGDGGLWQLAYLCNPERAEGTMFLRDWFRYGLPLEEPTRAS